MAKKRLYFGTKEKMRWVNCPAVNIERNRARWEASGQFLNGGAYQDNSKYGHLKYNIDWNLMSSDDAADILDYYHGLYSDGLIYFLEPFALRSNVLPLHWSTPRLCAEDAPSLIKGKRPSLSTAFSGYDFPGKSAAYTLASGDAPDSVYIPVPPGENFYFGARGSATGSAGVRVIPDSGTAATVTPAEGQLLATNLVTNPSGRNTSGTVEVRRNRAVVPAPGSESGPGPLDASSTGWGTGGAGTVTYPVAFYDPNWVRATRMTWTSAPTAVRAASDIMLAIPANRVAVTPGVPETFSVMVRSSRAQNVCLHGEYLTASGGGLSGDRSPSVNLVPGVWTRLILTSTPPPTAATLRVDLDTGSSPVLWQVGDYLDATRLMIGPGDYFDGQISPDPDLTPAWTGATYNSPSILTAPKPVGWAAVRGVVYYSAARDRLAFRVDSDGGLTYAYTAVGNQQGKTITALAEVELTPPGAPLNVAAYKYGTGLTYTPVTDKALVRHAEIDPRTNPNVVFGVRPADAPTYGGTIYFRMAAVEGEYTGLWFDGSQPPALAKNLAPNPRPQTASTGWLYGSGTSEQGSSVIIPDEPGPRGLDGFMRRLITTPKTGASTGWQYIVSDFPGSQGVTYTASMWLRPPLDIYGGPMSTRFRITFRNGAAATPGGSFDSTPIELPAGVWTKVEVSGTAPENFDNLFLWAYHIGVSAGQAPAVGNYDATQVSITTDGSYYTDGNMPDGMWLGAANNSASIRYDTDRRVAWTGTANASTSTLTEVDVPPLSHTFINPGGVTISLTGTGTITLNSMTGMIGTKKPAPKRFRAGEGHTGVRFTGVPNRTGYSSIQDKESVSAEFTEVGAWE